MSKRRTPSAKRRRASQKPVPASLESELAPILATVARMVGDAFLDELRVADAIDEGSVLDRIRKFFTVGAGRKEVAKFSAKMGTWLRGNVSRIEGIRPAQLVSSRVLATIDQGNIDLVTDAAKNQIDRLGTVLAENRGLHVKGLREKIQEATGATEAKAELWARDQTLRRCGDLSEERHKELGIESYIWTTVSDERVRHMHAELNGKTFKYSDPPIVNKKGDRKNPGQDYQCRCIAYPVTASSAILRDEPSRGRVLPAPPTAPLRESRKSPRGA